LLLLLMLRAAGKCCSQSKYACSTTGCSAVDVSLFDRAVIAIMASMTRWHDTLSQHDS
jgi:hypothetical protein